MSTHERSRFWAAFRVSLYYLFLPWCMLLSGRTPEITTAAAVIFGYFLAGIMLALLGALSHWIVPVVLVIVGLGLIGYYTTEPENSGHTP